MPDGAPVIDALTLIEERLQAAGKKVKRSGNKLNAQCPAHDDSTPSFSATYGTQRDIVMHCFAGCKPDDILRSLNIEWTDFGESNPKERPIDQWVYKNVDGKPLFRVVKLPGKQFKQHAYIAATGEWAKKLGDTERVPYRLPELSAAIDSGDTIWIAEGEKDCDALVANGLVATCNPGGAGKFTKTIANWLRGATNVIIVADRDDPGISHAEDVVEHLTALGVPATIVQAAEGKDAYDHFAFGHSVDDFIALHAPGNDPTSETWSEPAPLGLEQPPEFPRNILPDWCEQMIDGIADEIQTPRDLPAMLAIGLFAILAGGRIRLKVRGTWNETLNLYVMVAMPPSAGKSPAQKLVFRPVDEWLEDERQRIEPEIRRAEQERRMIESEMTKAEKSGERTQAAILLDELTDKPLPQIPRLWTEDATPEAFVQRLHDYGGRMSIVSTEGGVFQLMAGRYSENISNLDPYLKAWSGDSISVDRVGRQSFTIPRPATSMVLTVQPSVLQQVGANVENRNRGLSARFMMSIPESHVGRRNLIDAPTLDNGIVDIYDRKIKQLIARLDNVEGAEMRLTDAAQRMFLHWRQSLENRRIGDLHNLAEWSTKLESSVARLAGLLHLVDDKAIDEAVDADSMQRAVIVGEYWIDHAKVAHELWDSDSTVGNAREIVDRMLSTSETETTVRDLMRTHRRRLATTETASEAVELLIERGWMRSSDEDGAILPARRGLDSPRLRLHPESRKWRNRRKNTATCRHVDHVPKDSFFSPPPPFSEDSTNTQKLGHEGHGDMTSSTAPTKPRMSMFDDEP